MVNREIYFVDHGQLFKKTVEVSWDNESMAVNKAMCSEEIFSYAERWMQPCVDVSTANSIPTFRRLSIYNVVDSGGNKIADVWKMLDRSKDVEYLPPGSYDLLYLSAMSESQRMFSLSIRSFYDTYFNSKKKSYSPAIALCALRLLYEQRKLDYLDDMNKFLHWYFINCRFPIEYIR